jgi:hypothetical protein
MSSLLIMENANIEIREVLDAKDLKVFISVPWAIYRDDPHWVPPLKFERKQAFADNHPFFRHARWKAWVAYRENVPVGRISAQIDELYLQRHDAHTGFFGLIEAVDAADVFSALFDAAEAWLKDQGMRSVLGPFNLNINQEMGCLVDGFDSPPYVMMGHAKPYYDMSIKNQGFEQAQDTLSYEMKAERFAMPESVQRLLQRLAGKITVRQVDRKNTSAELEIMRSIFNDAWSENWGFVPFTEEEFQAVGKELFMIVPPEYSWIAEADGEPAAFIVLLPNLNEAIADLNGKLLPFGWARLLWRLKVRSPKTGRIPLMGVRKNYQNTRLGPALAFLTMRALSEPVLERGLERAEASWILEQNQPMRNILEKVGAVVTKRYRMYRKTLH